MFKDVIRILWPKEVKDILIVFQNLNFMVIWLVGNRKHLLIRQLRHRLEFRTSNIHRTKSHCTRSSTTSEGCAILDISYAAYVINHTVNVIEPLSQFIAFQLRGHSTMAHSTGSRIKTEDYKIMI